MVAKEIIQYLASLSTVEALWWFIENREEHSEWNSEVFFYLRERVRLERK